MHADLSKSHSSPTCTLLVMARGRIFPLDEAQAERALASTQRLSRQDGRTTDTLAAVGWNITSEIRPTMCNCEPLRKSRVTPTGYYDHVPASSADCRDKRGSGQLEVLAQ